MEDIIQNMPNVKKFNEYITDINNKVNPIMLSGLTDMGKIHLSYATKYYTKRPICIITYNEIQAKKLVKDMEFFFNNVVYFPKREILTYDYIAESKEILNDRIDALNKICNNESDIIITTIEAVSQKIIPKDILFKNMLEINLGESYDLEEIKEKLVCLGYERYELVEGKGQFSIRGGILDIATNGTNGIRIEFFGDEVDSIRTFSISTQRSIEMIKSITIYPAYELVLETSIEKVCDNIRSMNYEKYFEDRIEEDIKEIENGEYINKVDKYFNSFYSKSATLLDYLNENTIVFLDEIERLKVRIDNIKKDTNNIVKNLIEKEKLVPDSIKNIGDYLEFIENLGNTKQLIYLEKQDIGFVDKKSMHAKRNGYSFSYREVSFFRSTIDSLFEEVKKGHKQTIIVNKTEEISKQIADLFIQNNINEPNVFNTIGSISVGFYSEDFDLLVVPTSELFEITKKRKKYSNEFKEGERVIFEDLKVGDYIVHKNHGIGQFIGINTITADSITKDYIKLKYDSDAILYVPTNALDNIRKYVASGDYNPKLNKLGSKEWLKTRNKVKANLREVAKELIDLYAKRSKLKGFAFSKDTEWQKEFEDTFEYQETDDQLRCIDEMKQDMELERPMDRLLCGDVGYGKTEVAIRGAFKACMDGKQVAYLVPTTILANQQYETFKSRMSNFPIKVAVLNRFKTIKEQKQIVKDLKLGELDIIIGTHRILSDDVEFKNLGLLIIDEEHRFGVKAKEKIKQLKNNIDVLAMSATPIPRTLHMSIIGIRDMSIIYDPPQNRKPVQTYVMEYDEDMIKEAITKELERDGQVFYLYNKVEDIEKKAGQIETLVPEAKVAYAHGKMSGKALEDIMIDFIDKRINVLVCTTILESGIDIPNANTIIVENADRLGLAQLYQIRGRVGRGNIQSYAYITYRRDKLLSEVAEKRLRAIKEFTEFGSGFKIAMRDLEIRGAGSILGEIQHGHIDSVGYDLYCKLLEEVLKEMQGIEVEEIPDIQIDINVSSYIPDDFTNNYNQKIEIYQNIALCRTENDIRNVIDELIDRYGRIPNEVENLLEVSRIKNLCREKGIEKIEQKDDRIKFYITDKFVVEKVVGLIQKYKTQVRFANDRYISYYFNDKNNIIREIKKFLNEI